MGSKQFADLKVAIIDEDPHLRRRVVSMKVLVLGYPRTGTSSMQKALEQLGFGPCYHMRTTINQYPRDCAMWLEAFEAKYEGRGTFEKKQWDQLLGNFSVSVEPRVSQTSSEGHESADHRLPTDQSVCDLPAIAFGPELMAAYPDAKLILTNRDPDSWHKSCGSTLLQARKYWLHAVLQHFDWVTGVVHPLRIKYWQCMFADDFEANGKAAMHAHYSEIRTIAQQTGRPVLEMGLGDGWGSLCGFLGVDVPLHPFPRMNEGEDWILKMRERARLRVKAAALKLFQFSLPLALLGFGFYHAASAAFRLDLLLNKDC